MNALSSYSAGSEVGAKGGGSPKYVACFGRTHRGEACGADCRIFRHQPEPPRARHSPRGMDWVWRMLGFLR